MVTNNSLLDEIKECLIKLHEMKDSFKGKKQYSVAVCMAGTKFNNGLMIIGRNANGWKEEVHYGEIADHNDFGEKFIQNFTDYNTHDCFGWIIEEDGKQRSIDVKNPYNCETSKFWTCNRELHKLLDNKDNCRIWQDYITQSDLYKISPRLSGNPTEKNKRIQKDICFELLKKEIEYFKPAYVLFETEVYRYKKPDDVSDGWLFDEIKNNLNKVPYADNSKYIRFEGYYSINKHDFCQTKEDDEPDSIRVAVAVHPCANGVSKDLYAQQCFEVLEI